jgi:hypothetical protein
MIRSRIIYIVKVDFETEFQVNASCNRNQNLQFEEEIRFVHDECRNNTSMKACASQQGSTLLWNCERPRKDGCLDFDTAL